MLWPMYQHSIGHRAHLNYGKRGTLWVRYTARGRRINPQKNLRPQGDMGAVGTAGVYAHRSRNLYPKEQNGDE